MILLEKIIAVCQEDNLSVAINSRRPSNHNPALKIFRTNNNFLWQLDGLHIGRIEEVAGQPRADRLDFYIGMDDLIAYRNLFPTTRARSLGLVDGLRIPTGRERVGGKTIRWKGPISRVEILETKIVVPPFKYSIINNIPITLNLDRETSPYPIENGNGRTIRELHFGLEHPFNLINDSRIRVARANILMSPEQYSTVLDGIDTAITIHQRT